MKAQIKISPLKTAISLPLLHFSLFNFFLFAVARAVVGRRRYAAGSWLRTLLLLFVVSFVWLQLHLAGLGLGFNGRGWRSNGQDGNEANDSAAILAMVPQVRVPTIRRFLFS